MQSNRRFACNLSYQYLAFSANAVMISSKIDPKIKVSVTSANNCGMSPHAFASCIIYPKLFAVIATTSADTTSFNEKEIAPPASRNTDGADKGKYTRQIRAQRDAPYTLLVSMICLSMASNAVKIPV